MATEKKYHDAFHTLNLTTSASKEEAEQQRKMLVKMYQSVNALSFKSKIEEVDNAAKLLIREYYVHR